MKVRDKLPVRREIPSRSPVGEKWSEHKPDLREDFNGHCGYCGSFDGFRHTYFEVDHFVPKSIFIPTGNIGLCQYDNLVYSCKFCNNIKHSKWPSQNEAIPNANNEGFVDPCSDEFDKHLYRTNNGSIRWFTELGKWMVEIGFKFDERDYAIKLLWELGRLKKAIDILLREAKKYNPELDYHKELIETASKYSLVYYQFHNELMEYYNEGL